MPSLLVPAPTMTACPVHRPPCADEIAGASAGASPADAADIAAEAVAHFRTAEVFDAAPDQVPVQ